MSFYLNRSQFVQNTRKELDGNDYLVAYDVPIAKTGIQQYTREELGDTEGYPEELLNVYRSRDVFEDKELIESFDGIPVVYEHPENGRVDSDNFKELIVGTISGVYYKEGSLYAKKITIIDKKAIENILGKKTNELSIGFRGKVTKSPGVFEGQNYHYQEDVIHANHLALCENGKAGSYYAINSKKGTKKMAFTTLSVSQEHERYKELKNSEVDTYNISGIVEQAVRKQSLDLKPHLINKEEEECLEETSPKIKQLKDSEDEDMDEMVNEEEESKEEEEAEDEDEEGEKELKKKEAKKKSEKKDLEDSVEEMEEFDKKDREIVNALKKSNEKLRSLVNKKNTQIKSLELNNITLERALDESKEYLRDLANRLKQKNLTNSMTGPDFVVDRKDDLLRNDFSQSLTSSFLYARK